MPDYALLTSTGIDQPGIVSSITRILLEQDCNIEDSQMSRLGPDFACMLMIRMPKGMKGEQLKDRLADVVDQLGLWMDIKDLSPDQVSKTQSDLPKHLIHVYGADHKGIVYKIAKHLADTKINITNLHTEVIHHDKPLYVMLIEVEIPNTTDTGRLQSELIKIGKEIEVVVSMKPKNDARF